MSEEQNSDPAAQTVAPQPTTAPAPAPTAPLAPEVKTFTQDEVDALVKERLARDRKSRNKQAPKQDAAPAETVDTDSRFAQMQQQLDAMTLKAEAAVRGIKDGAQLSLLASAYQAERPGDMGEWLDRVAPALGVATPSEAPPPNALPQPPSPVASPAPVSDGGAPAVAQNFDGMVDVKTLSKDDIDRLQGNGRFHEILERYRTGQPGGGNRLFGGPRKKG